MPLFDPNSVLGKLLAPEVALPMAAALMGQQGNGQNLGNAFAMGGQGLAQQKKLQAQTADTNKTLEFLRTNSPDLAGMVDAGMPVNEAWKIYSDQRYAKPVGDSRPQSIQEWEYGQKNPEFRAAQGGGDDYSKRRQAAEANGLTPDHPAYQSFILTGKMPREDQAPLTQTDKKAILEADEMVAANENAIAALTKAEALSGSANSGWLAGTRAMLGNNLPDAMVPDFVSSPESSLATTDMDNTVVGQALASMKSIFGGNPTEGERQILLQLQGSSSMQPEARARVFARAKELAARRLEFNRQRAAELRGGTFYRSQGAGGGAPAPAGGPAEDPLGIR